MLGLPILVPKTSVSTLDLAAHECLSPRHRCEEISKEASSLVGANTISTVASNVRIILGANLASVSSIQTVRSSV
jgi:hypothetical protein